MPAPGTCKESHPSPAVYAASCRIAGQALRPGPRFLHPPRGRWHSAAAGLQLKRVERSWTYALLGGAIDRAPSVFPPDIARDLEVVSPQTRGVSQGTPLHQLD